MSKQQQQKIKQNANKQNTQNVISKKMNEFNKNSILFLFKNIPIHFISYIVKDDEFSEITIISKSNVYSCQIVNELHLSFDENWKNNEIFHKQQIFNYITTFSENGMFILPFSSLKQKSNSHSEIMKLFLQSIFINHHGTVFCVECSTVLKQLFYIYNIEYDKSEIVEFFNQNELDESIQLCEYHKIHEGKCSVEKVYFQETIVQHILKEKNIQLQHEDKLKHIRKKLILLNNQLNNDKSQQTIQRIPFTDITALCLFSLKESNEYIEVGYSMIKQNQNENNGEFVMILNPNILQCKPIKMKEGLEYFVDKYNLDDCLYYIIQNVISQMNYDIVLYNDEMFMNLLFRKDSSTQILLQNKPMSNLSDFFEQIYFRNSQPNKNVLVEILEKSKNDFIENSKSAFACEYHCKNQNAYSCLLQSPFIFLHQLNFAITSPQQMTVMLYDKLTCYETLKQWINNVPIYFMTTDGMGKLIMVMKNNIYDCKTVDVQEWMITKAQNQNFEIIGNYLKSKNNRAIIVVHDSTQTNLKILIIGKKTHQYLIKES